MYCTCIFCTRSLGHNEALEHFPVGRRLAFDAAKGRLWVICIYCRRWNLTPLEERWEAVEEAEKLFRATRLRASTDHIGLARVVDGTDLVRIGSPQRPELAAWRYGRQFTHRRRKRLLTFGAAVVGGSIAAAGAYFVGAAAVVGLMAAQVVYRYAEDGGENAIARLRDPNGALIHVRRQHLNLARIGVGTDGGLALDIEHGERRSTHFEGVQARRAAAALFPMVNHRGATADDVQIALRRLIHAGSADQFLVNLARRNARLPSPRSEYDDSSFEIRLLSAREDTGLLALPPTLGLAIEMALHDEQERQALEGELTELEDAWRVAEEIGAIADEMFLPSSIEKALARLRLR